MSDRKSRSVFYFVLALGIIGCLYVVLLVTRIVRARNIASALQNREMTVELTLDDRSGSRGIVYVAEDGMGDGLSAGTPLGRLDMAFRLAQTNGASEIRISGDPIVGEPPILSNISHFKVTGGWNSRFTGQSEASLLNGRYRIDNVMYFENCSYITISNVIETGAEGTGIVLIGDVCTVYTSTCNNWGRGIFVQGNYNTVIATITGNQSIYNGAGLYVEGNDNLFKGNVSGNDLWGEKVLGGGIFLKGSSNIVEANVTGNTLTATNVGGGCGVFISGNRNAFTGTVTGNVMSGSFGTYGNGKKYAYGNGVYIYGTNNVFRGDITGNTASGYNVSGTGVFVDGDSNAFYGNISENTARATHIAAGGGVYIQGNGNTFNGNFISNTVVSGGGISIYASRTSFSVGVLNDVGRQYIMDFAKEISGGDQATSNAFGGGIFIHGDGNAYTGTISGNTASAANVAGGGGAVVYGSGNTFGGTIAGNTAEATRIAVGGGAEIIYGKSNLFDSSVTGNTVLATDAGEGGGLAILYGKNNAFGGDVTGNVVLGSTESFGGGLFICRSGGNRFVMSRIADNQAQYGGGVYVNLSSYVNSASNTFSCRIFGNHADKHGGGVYNARADGDFRNALTLSNSPDNVYFGPER